MKTEQTELVTAQSVAPAIAQNIGNDPIAKMLSAVIEKGVTSESVGALEKLCDLYERMQQKDAEKQFAAAFVALQNDLPVIVANTVIPNRGKYERFEDVMRVVSPLLVKHGFSVAFSMDFKENRIVETCHLTHIAGVTKSNSFAVRAGGRADSDTQADCKAATTAKRNALLNCLNIVIRQDAYQNEDADASLEGSPLAPDQVIYIKELLAETKSDVAAFLRFAGADKVESITTGRYSELVAALHKKAHR